MMNPLTSDKSDLYSAVSVSKIAIRDESKDIFLESKKTPRAVSYEWDEWKTEKIISNSKNACENNNSEKNIPDINVDEIHGVSQVKDQFCFNIKNSVENKTSKNGTCCHNKVFKDGCNQGPIYR